MRSEAHFKFFRAWLLVCCGLFTLQALSWAILGTFDPFGTWEKLMYQALFKKEVAEVGTFYHFILGPFGASVAAYFSLFCLVYFAFPRWEAWAYWATFGSFYVWMLTDSVASTLRGGCLQRFHCQPALRCSGKSSVSVSFSVFSTRLEAR